MAGSTRIFKTRSFSRWARRVGVGDAALRSAVQEMEAGLVDADLGGGLVKKRVRLEGRGKRGGARTIVATNRSDRWIFLLGLAKNVRENLGPVELRLLRIQASAKLDLHGPGMDREIESGNVEAI